MVVKMALNAPRVAKMIYCNVSAKFEHMLIWLKSIENQMYSLFLTSITGIVFLAIFKAIDMGTPCKFRSTPKI
jgi:hypothetical protein